ncbi:DUF6543 domain-containing protein [Pseudomonas sp. RIT-PI-S]|uniref:dermonecrotic toxin domain-containing protein n=1 Tax=Pseudomonas sp. RIT-PI-S TaxID=3035295 RepID=UPI0021D85632|nr:DUF6543 domain-containing protein [Pseudomonas sp. RIT-PI-S]
MTVDARTRQMAELIELSQRWFADYPDLDRAAEMEAKRLLRAHHLEALDVHAVYWHRFDNAQSSEAAFTGWAHGGPPSETLTLPRLVLQRFASSDQERLDQLDMFSGFYTRGAGEGRYDERCEIGLLPSRVSADFWHTDFATHYRSRLSYFWRTRTTDFIALGRASALVSLAHARDAGYLGEVELSTLRGALAAGVGTDLSPANLGRQRPPRAGLRITGLSIEGHAARDMLRIHDVDGGQYLYMPSRMPPVQRFASNQALAAWLARQATTAQGLALLQARFALNDDQARAAVAKLAEGKLAPGWLGGDALPVNSDPFAWLAEQAEAEMLRHAHEALTSNSRLRKDAAIAFLSTLSRLASDLAPVGWPVALVALASAGTALGLDIEKAIDARSHEERSGAIAAAFGQGLTALLTLPFLGSGEVADWQWEVGQEDPTSALTAASLPSSPVSAWPLNSRGMIERTDVEVLFAVQEAARDEPATALLSAGLPASTRFVRLAPMIDGPVLRAFGNAEGALAYAQANFDGPFHLFRIQARGLRVASLRLNLRLNRANTLALLGQEDQALSAPQLEALADGAWLEHEAHLALAEMSPARLRLLSPLARQPWRRPAVKVLRGVQQQQLNSVVAPGHLIEVDDSLRLVRFDPFSESWRTARGSAFRYNESRAGFELFDVTQVPDAPAASIEAATAELGIPASYPWTIPDLPSAGRLPLPRTIHSIWLGRRMPGKLVDNLLRNAAQAGSGAAPFDYHLYLAIDDPLDHTLTLADLAAAAPNLKVQELKSTEFFRSFAQSPYYQQYLAATEGSGINYASAADVLRYRMLHHFGGVYMDVDDVIYAGTQSGDGFAEKDWTVAPGKLLLNGLVSEPRLGLHCGFNTSNFATLPDNPVLAQISEESYMRFLANRDLYYRRPYEGADSHEAVTAYARRINQVTGPGVFNDVLMERQPELQQFRSICRIATELYVPARHLAALHRQIRTYTPSYCPLAWRIRIGATSSWLHTR